jgi:hypothetical protein
MYNPIVYEVSLLSSQNYFVLHLYVKPVAVDTVKIFVIILLFVDSTLMLSFSPGMYYTRHLGA